MNIHVKPISFSEPVLLSRWDHLRREKSGKSDGSRLAPRWCSTIPTAQTDSKYTSCSTTQIFHALNQLGGSWETCYSRVCLYSLNRQCLPGLHWLGRAWRRLQWLGWAKAGYIDLVNICSFLFVFLYLICSVSIYSTNLESRWATELTQWTIGQ